MSVLIKGGRVVTAADDYVGDIYVEDERITLIGESLDVQADKVIDAVRQVRAAGVHRPAHASRHAVRRHDHRRRLRVRPHLGGLRRHDDPRRLLPPGQGPAVRRRARDWHGKANGKAVIDYGFHLAVTDLEAGGTLEDLARVPDEGVTSYKLFMAYKGAIMVDDETLFRVMQVAADTGALVMVHAEHGDAIDVLVKKALADGNTEPHWHALTRPPETEGEATHRAIHLARVAGAPLYVVHVSCKDAIDPIAHAREKGWDIWGETCTQYFFIDYSFLERPDFEGGKYVYTPPPRPKEHQDAPVGGGQERRPVGGLDRPLRVPLGRPEVARQGRLLEDPERRPGDRGPADDDPPVRRPRGADLAEPDGGAAGDEPGEAVRPLPAQGHGRGRLGRRSRRLRPGEAATLSASTPALEVRLQPLRGHGGAVARPRWCCCAGTCSSRGDELSRGRGRASSCARARFGETASTAGARATAGNGADLGLHLTRSSRERLSRAPLKSG